ncbi:methyltransferase family protein [Epibacterium sp. Ofav1-8]|uniref:methyltransferase family protein n=1 Tax=Epibacterium sp. Ofav1-8 TaxID=2917735 RepID=UPI001EF58162|nr:NnrU family protein [Epibacterium sp. Ofav1-8]MCG7626085.1 hypothetical protein [Epibacterium sp. Ofav1-8]
MKNLFFLIYALLSYALFGVAFLLMVAFLLSLPGLPSRAPSSVTAAVLFNTGMIFAFGATHSVMARDWFKRRWTRIVAPDIERATYVLQSSLFLIAIVWFWQPMPAVLWSFEGPAMILPLLVFALGAAMVVVSTFLLGHLEFVGIAQPWNRLQGGRTTEDAFRTPFLYRVVRHPLQLGLLLIFYFIPEMTVGHLLFAGLMTVYMLVGLHFEEKSLVKRFGDTYRTYQGRVPMLLPRLLRPRLK